MLARILSVHPGEGRIVLRLGSHFFLVLAATTLHLTIGEGLFIGVYPARWLPYAFLGGAILGTLASLAYEVLQRKWKARSFSTAVAGSFAGLLLILWGGLYLLPKIGPFALFVAVPLGSVLLGIENASLVARTLDSRSARRLFPVIGICGSLGVVFGGLLTGLLSRTVGVPTLLGVASAFVLLSMIPARGGEAAVRRSPRVAPAPWRRILRYRFALLLIGLVILAGLVSTIVRFQMGSCLKETWPPERIASFLGLFSAALSATAVLFQLAASRFLIARLGVGASLAVHPAALVAAGGLGIGLGGLGAATGALFLDRLLRHNLLRPILNVALMPLPDAIRSRTTVAVQGTLEPLAIGIGCLGIVATAGAVPWRSLSFAVAGLGALALACALLARKSYVRELTSALHARRLRTSENAEDPPDVEAGVRELLHDQIRSGSPERVSLAIQLLEGRGTRETVEAVRERWSGWAPWVKVRALRALSLEPVAEAVAFLQTLSPDEPAEVRTARLRSDAVQVSERDLEGMMENDAPEVKAEAMIRALRRGGLAGIRPRLETWIRSENDGLRRAAASVLGHVEDPALLETLHELALVAPVETLQAVARRPDGRFADLCVRCLTDDRTFLPARDALVRIGSPAVAALVSAARDPDLSVPAIHLLGEIDAPESRRFLLGLLSDSDEEIRYRAAKTLLRRGLEGEEERDLVREAIRRELDEAGKKGADFPWAVERALVLLSLLYPDRPFRKISLSYSSSDPRQKGFAIEALEENLDGEWRSRILPILEGVRAPVSAAERSAVPDSVCDRAILLQKSPLFCEWRIRELEPLAVASLEGNRGPAWIVLRGTEPVELERSLLGTPPEPAEGDFVIPLGILYRTIVRRPRCGLRWLHALGRRLPGLAMGRAFSQSHLSVGSRTAGEEENFAGDLGLWQRIFFLRSIPLFEELSPERIRLLAEIVRPTSAARGETIVREGTPGYHFYMLCSGYAEVLVGGRRVATIPEGSGFGELALLTGEPRTATVRALVPCEMLSIDRVDFLDLLSAHPLLVKSFATMIAQRILEQHRMHRGP